MTAVLELEFRERVTLDPDRLVELCLKLGDQETEDLITRSMAELAEAMALAEAAHISQNMGELVTCCQKLVNISENIGMTSFARVANDVLYCTEVYDQIALAATLERLNRIAMRSLNAVIDMQDVSG